MTTLTKLLLRRVVPAALALVSALPACSSAGRDAGDNETADELGAVCGGIANLHCPAGQECVIASNLPDDTGNCFHICGGFAGITCPTPFTCVLSDNFPDAFGLCRSSPRPTCQTLTCRPGYHCEEKGLNGGPQAGVCLHDPDAGTDAGIDAEADASSHGPHCTTIECLPGYHCEERGLDGGPTHGVCLHDTDDAGW